jgi:GT2 family glycosyltransferase
MNEELTVIFFSCRRLQLLYQAISAFLDLNTYPFVDFIIVNDSGDPAIWKQIEDTYPGATFVFNKENVGLIKSVDLGYEHIKTEYFFHIEDDWMITKGGFIEQSLAIMKSNPKIEEVWLADYNVQPFEPQIYVTNDQPLVTSYRLIGENYQKGMNGYNDFAWHGFTTACGMKRLSDYKKIGPYVDIPWQGTIWHREQAIGERYHQLGYRTALLMDEYAVNIGYGQSEYITGDEK